MTNMIPYSYHPTSAYDELPGISSTETTRGQPLPAKGSAAYVEDNCLKVLLHVVVSLFMFTFFVIGGLDLWPDRHDMIIAAIFFFYSTVMIHLLLIKRREEEKQRELEARDEIGIIMRVQWAPMLMFIATGVVLISLEVTIFVLRPDWLYLAFIALMALVSTVMMLFLLKVEEISRNKPLRAPCEDTFDQV